jgi:hypothetical protein
LPAYAVDKKAAADCQARWALQQNNAVELWKFEHNSHARKGINQMRDAGGKVEINEVAMVIIDAAR